MNLPSDVLSAIINTAGSWALSMASSPDQTTRKQPSPMQMSEELEKDYNFAFDFLEHTAQEYLESCKSGD